MRDYRVLSQRILRSANSDGCHVDFLRDIANMLLDFSECDAAVLHFGREGRYIRYEAARDAEDPIAVREKVGTSALPETMFSWSTDRRSYFVPIFSRSARTRNIITAPTACQPER
jgi:hypothetical protein